MPHCPAVTWLRTTHLVLAAALVLLLVAALALSPDTESFEPHANAPSATVFVSVPSYRDTDCTKTLQSLFANAEHPERVFVGLYEQNDPDTPEENCTLVGTPYARYEANVRRTRVPHTDAKGPLWARQHITEMYAGETYFLMVDAHTVFLRNWDTRMAQELDYLRDHHGVAKPILSSYPHHGTALETPTSQPTDAKRGVTTTLCDVKKAGRYPLVIGSQECASGKYYRTMFLGAGFVFTYGPLCATLRDALRQLHLPQVFDGEESLFAAVAYTNGWDIYAPPFINVFHHYSHAKPSWYVDNVSNQTDASAEKQQSEATLRAVLDREDNAACMGTERTLASYWREMGFRRDVRIVDDDRTDEAKARDVFPESSRDRWCARAETLDYPLVERFVSGS